LWRLHLGHQLSFLGLPFGRLMALYGFCAYLDGEYRVAEFDVITACELGFVDAGSIDEGSFGRTHIDELRFVWASDFDDGMDAVDGWVLQAHMYRREPTDLDASRRECFFAERGVWLLDVEKYRCCQLAHGSALNSISAFDHTSLVNKRSEWFSNRQKMCTLHTQQL
jgi:hypothetical protein